LNGKWSTDNTAIVQNNNQVTLLVFLSNGMAPVAFVVVVVVVVVVLAIVVAFLIPSTLL
jgi:hypothetical protein